MSAGGGTGGSVATVVANTVVVVLVEVVVAATVVLVEVLGALVVAAEPPLEPQAARRLSTLSADMSATARVHTGALRGDFAVDAISQEANGERLGGTRRLTE
jgi:hypothetical protein